MALILLCEEDIDPTGSDVRCVRNDRICDIIFQLYLSAQCKITPLTNQTIIPFWVNLSDHLQKSASHNPNSERKKILTSSPETWTYGNTDLAVFVPLVDHFPCENSILLDFYTPRVPTISVNFWGTNPIGTEGGLHLLRIFEFFGF